MWTLKILNRRWTLIGLSVAVLVVALTALFWHRTGEGSFSHVLSRSLLHLITAPGTMLIAATVWRVLSRRFRTAKGLPRSMEQTLIYAAFTAVLFAWSREAWDVSRGQPLFKVPFDYFSHALGLFGFGGWGLYRWKYFDWD